MEQRQQAPEITDVRILTAQEISRAGLAAELILLVEEAKIDTNEHVTIMVDHLRRIDLVLKEIEEERKERLAAINDGVKEFNGKYRQAREELEEAKKKLQKMLGEYQAEKERKTAEAAAAEEKRLADEAAAAAKKLEEEALAEAERLEEQGSTEAAQEVLDQAGDAAKEVLTEAADAPKPAPPPKALLRGAHGASASFRTNWLWELEDIAKVPKEFFILDEMALGALVRSTKGRRQIPGIRIYSERKIVGR